MSGHLSKWIRDGRSPLIVFPPVINRRHPCNFFEDITESLGVGVADMVHHFADGFSAGLEILFGGFNLHPLNVLGHGVVGGFLEPPLEAPAADAELVGELVHRDLVIKMGLNEFLCLFHFDVFMALLPLE